MKMKTIQKISIIILLKDVLKRTVFRSPCLGCFASSCKSIMFVNEFNMDEIDLKVLSYGDMDLGFMCYKVVFDDNGIQK